jgi:glucosamine-6-phosphate deaminase
MPFFSKKKNIKFIPCIDEKELSTMVSSIICESIKKNPNTVLGLSAGVSVGLLYDCLVRETKKQAIDFSDVTSFNTDEYIDIDKRYQKYSKINFMRNHLFSRVNIKVDNTHFPTIDNYKSYDHDIQKVGGIDLLILSVGPNGYIGFNEPNTKFNSVTHQGDLDNSTRTYLMNFFDEKINVPHRVVTMGIKTILQAKKIILVAIGELKSAPISKLFENKYSAV